MLPHSFLLRATGLRSITRTHALSVDPVDSYYFNNLVILRICQHPGVEFPENRYVYTPKKIPPNLYVAFKSNYYWKMGVGLKLNSKRFLTVSFAILILVVGIAPQTFAAEGITQISLSTSVAKPGEKITIEFEINAPQNADQKYGISVSFTGLRLFQSFATKAELFEGNQGVGKWRAIATIPTEIFTDTYRINFKGLGPGRPPRNLVPISNVVPAISILGQSGPIYPQIEISNITTDKASYVPGERININFQSRILSGAVNSEDENPTVLVKDTKNNLILRATPRTKPPIATGSYESGNWSTSYLLPQDMLSTQAQVEIRFPGSSNFTFGIAKGTVFSIQSLKNEIKILDIKLNKSTYQPNEPIQVTFKTSSNGLLSNETNKPVLMLTDNEYSDFGIATPAILTSGNINLGSWSAEIKQVFKDGDYFIAFYNSEGSIRETGPLLRIRTIVNSSITCVKGKLTKKVTGTSPKCPKGFKKV